MKRIFLILTLCILPWGSNALAIDAYDFKNIEDAERFKKLSEELRCLVCQNQNLADSNAGLAIDLKDEVFGMIQQGKSNPEIKDFLVQRYGDFVLYDPPMKTTTLLLWLGPFIMLIGGVFILLRIVRTLSARRKESTTLDTDEQHHLDEMLKGGEEKK